MTRAIQREVYAVGPVTTDVATLTTRDTRRLSLSVTNLDGSQVVDGTILSAVWAGDDSGLADSTGLAAIQPGETRRLDLDTAGCDAVTLRFVASGAGCDIRVSARPDEGRR